jgi:23S rRNA pseudouridine2605 synthase
MPHGKSPKHARKKKTAAKAKPTSRGGGKTSSATSSSASFSASKPRKRKRAGGANTLAAFEGPVRLQKLLAAAGFGSRRDTEQFLIDERVTVNRRVATLGDSADPRVDEIRVDGERLVRERPAYWILNKPRGIVTTMRDEAGRKTVVDFIPSGAGRLYPVGRLDKETSGLLLLTNDGDTAHALLHPSLGNEREYKVNVKGLIDAKAIGRLEKGIVLEEGRTSPGQVRQVRQDSEAGTSNFLLTLGEGRKRQIRRSLLVLGFPVRRLVRVRMGSLRLGRLAVGEARPLRPHERQALLDHAAALRGEKKPAAPRKPTARKTQRTPRSRNGTST